MPSAEVKDAAKALLLETSTASHKGEQEDAAAARVAALARQSSLPNQPGKETNIDTLPEIAVPEPRGNRTFWRRCLDARRGSAIKDGALLAAMPRPAEEPSRPVLSGRYTTQVLKRLDYKIGGVMRCAAPARVTTLGQARAEKSYRPPPRKPPMEEYAPSGNHIKDKP